MQETIIETDKYRVIAEPDPYAEEPAYDDGATPILRLNFLNSIGIWQAEAFNDQAKPYVNAYNRFSDSYTDWNTEEVFERYLKIFHDTAKVQSFGLNNTRATDSTYLAFDTAEWRDKVGCTKENVAKEDYLSEVRAWIEGDTYNLVLQKKVIWSADDDDYEDREEWEDVDSVGGFYGQDGLEDSAKWYFSEELGVTD